MKIGELQEQNSELGKLEKAIRPAAFAERMEFSSEKGHLESVKQKNMKN